MDYLFLYDSFVCLFFSFLFVFIRIMFNTNKYELNRMVDNSRKFVHVNTKLVTVVKSDPKAPFSVATTLRCRGGRYSFSRLLHFTL